MDNSNNFLEGSLVKLRELITKIKDYFRENVLLSVIEKERECDDGKSSNYLEGRIFDALARVLAVQDPCTALSIYKEEILITNNEDTTTSNRNFISNAMEIIDSIEEDNEREDIILKISLVANSFLMRKLE